MKGFIVIKGQSFILPFTQKTFNSYRLTEIFDGFCKTWTLQVLDGLIYILVYYFFHFQLFNFLSVYFNDLPFDS